MWSRTDLGAVPSVAETRRTTAFTGDRTGAPIGPWLLPIALLLLAAALPFGRLAFAASAAGRGPLPLVARGFDIFGLSIAAFAVALALYPRLDVRGARGRPLALAWTPPSSEPGVALLAISALVVLAVALRLPHLGDGLWLDEIRTLVDYVRLPLVGIVTTYDNQNQHPLYSVVAHAVVRMAGDSAWALRLPALAFGAASLAAAYAFGRGVTSRAESMLAAAVLVGAYHHVWFSQNARGYTALLFLTIISSAAFLRLVSLEQRQRATGAIALYAIATALALYTHATAAVLPLAHALIALVLVVRRGFRDQSWQAPLAGLVAAALVTMLLYAPVLPQMIATLRKPTMEGVDVEWKHTGWMVGELLRGLQSGIPGGLVVLVPAAACGIVGVVSYARRNPAALAVMLLPALLTAVAIVALHHNFWPRFFFFSAAFAVLIGIRGVAAIVETAAGATVRDWALGGLGVATVAACALAPRAWGPKQDYVAAKRFVERTAAAGDTVLTLDITSYPLRAYLGARWDSVATVSQLEAAEAGHRRTFVVYTFPVRLAAIKPDVMERLHTKYRVAATFPGSVNGGEVVVAESAGDSTNSGAKR